MNKKILMALGAVFAAGALVAAPGNHHGNAPRGGGAPHTAAPRASVPSATHATAHAPRASAPAPRAGKPAATHSRAAMPQAHKPVAHAPAPRAHAPAPRVHAPAPRVHAPAPRVHAPPPPRHHHAAPRFLHPRWHHVGERHVVIVPPTVLVNEYYWTEEVFIDGYYYILYCYPDGTKRFADGTIYCYF